MSEKTFLQLGSSLDVRVFESVKETFEYINSPEITARVKTYEDSVHYHCEKGLSSENLALYRAWHAGTYRPSREEQLKTSEENPELYGAIMESISWGLG